MRLRNISSLASPSHSLNGWGSCSLANIGKSIFLHVSKSCPMETNRTWFGLRQAPTLLFLFLFFFIFNCILEKPRIIVQCSVSTPTMIIFVIHRFSWPSDNDKTVWEWGQINGVRTVWCLRCGTPIISSWRLVVNIKCPDCDSQCKIKHP